jgi:hypothetical protein
MLCTCSSAFLDMNCENRSKHTNTLTCGKSADHINGNVCGRYSDSYALKG